MARFEATQNITTTNHLTVEEIAKRFKIKSVKGLTFVNPENGNVVIKPSGLAFFDTVQQSWVASETFDCVNGYHPYIPVGGRAALKQIIADCGEFFDVTGRVTAQVEL